MSRAGPSRAWEDTEAGPSRRRSREEEQQDEQRAGLSAMWVYDGDEAATILHMTGSVTDILGYHPQELIGRAALDYLHPEELTLGKEVHFRAVSEQACACVAYHRIKHKDGTFIQCCSSYSMVYGRVVGTWMRAEDGPRSIQQALTARTVIEISVDADGRMVTKRWALPPTATPPSPFPPLSLSVNPYPHTSHYRPPTDSSSSSSSTSRSDSPPSLAHIALTPSHPQSQQASQHPRTHRSRAGAHRPLPPFAPIVTVLPSSSDRSEDPARWEHLPPPVPRTAFFVDRFTDLSRITYVSNEVLVTRSAALIGQPFYSIVRPSDRPLARQYIEAAKEWSPVIKYESRSGGHGYCRFDVLKIPDLPPTDSPNPQGTDVSERSIPGQEFIPVEAMFTASSDGLMCILERIERMREDVEPGR